MDAATRLNAAVFLLLLLFPVRPTYGQNGHYETQGRNWDFGIWVAGATGEENTNSFGEAQTVSAGVFAGKEVTGEVGGGWRQGRLEYGVSIIPIFWQLRPQRIYGGGFEPVILRWNSSLHARSLAPYIELAGGGLRTTAELPARYTSDFNFTVRGGGGIQIFTKGRRFVEIGCQWAHISNANLGVRNPEFNGIQVSLGFHWFR